MAARDQGVPSSSSASQRGSSVARLAGRGEQQSQVQREDGVTPQVLLPIQH